MNLIVVLISLLFPFATSLSVLWIGNSFTYYNDLPAMVAEMAASDGRAYEYDSHLEGGWSWEKHAASEVTMDKIRSRQWDVVVLQEYSTRAAYPEDDVCIQTVPPLDALVAAILTNNPATKIQFYLSWGRPGGEPNLCTTMPQFCSYDSYQDALTEGYMKLACMKKPAHAAPVGEGFRYVKQVYGEEMWEQLYVPGDKHPSLAGSFLSAVTHFMALYDMDYVNDDIPTFGLSEEVVNALVESAYITRFSGDWSLEADTECSIFYCSSKEGKDES